MEDQLTSVREQHKFNVGNLQRYLYEKSVVSKNDILTVRQYSAGQSNPTFLIQTPSRSYVLRKKPPGELLPGAHKVDREYRVQTALFSAGFPVPQPLLFCNEAEVIGTEFYLMEHVKQGRIFRDFQLPGMSPAQRTSVYTAAVENLAKLHSLDLPSLKLEGFGRGPGYCRRQVSTWTKQYTASAHRDIPAVNELCDWLMRNLPDKDDEVTLVHGDYRLDNLIFHPTETRVMASLDWELSTTGSPLADLAFFLVPLYCPTGLNIKSFIFNLQEVEGIPSPSDLISIYCRCRGIPSVSLPPLNFYLALSLFKAAAISQGIYARYLLGNASAPDAAQYGQNVEPLAKAALQLAKRLATLMKWKTMHRTKDRLFPQTAKGQAVLQQVKDFMQQYVLPAQQVSAKSFSEDRAHFICSDRLQEKAKQAGLWNLFLPAVSGLTQLDYAYIAEEMGRCLFAPEVFNCQAPDTGNMEVLHMFGTEEQKKKWLEPLLSGEIRSCFCMTEPDVASSDGANMECRLHRDKTTYIINGKKWWSSGAGSATCKVAIVMWRCLNFFLRHGQHSMILVPMDTPGVKLIRPLTVFGHDDAIHGGHFEVHFENVRVPASNMILGEGRGFEIAQRRLGPGRLHHCMRAVGCAEQALELLCRRAASRRTFGKNLYQHEVIAHWIGECRLMIEQTRLLTLSAAHALDALGSRAARKQIAMIKVAAARMVCKVVDCAIQVHGGAGVSGDFPLAQMYSYARTLRIADGPDEVHLSSIAILELKDQLKQARARL
uniref:Acyl-CoA dehydrogenase family member 11 n=1 Tax=Poecilia mexicana TaxID=48701 RepID=A0A3B3YND6_9TELE